MASVWVARLVGKHGFEKLVAIKTILPQFAADSRFQRMFLDEARIASHIEHTNVTQILDLGEQHDILYLVMEFVDGDSLSRLFHAVRKSGVGLPPKMALRILADTCGGLHAAHELRGPDGTLLELVHRDVSPQNILLSPLGVAKLIDFGIAKARGRLGEETNAGLLKGKIRYMAPEQATGGRVDRRSDIFAIGAILYHLLSGNAPFDGENQLAILHRLTSRQPPLPLPSTVHPAVAAIARKALAHSPDARHATAAEMQIELEAAMVEAKLTCTTAEVARFIHEQLADRAHKRKASIDLALSAAAERQRVQQLLRPLPDQSLTGVSTLATIPGRASSPQLGSSSGITSVPGAPLSNADVAQQSVSTPYAAALGGESAAALGGESAAGVRPASRKTLVIAVVVALIIGVGGTALFARSRATPAAKVMRTPATATGPSAAQQPTVVTTATAPPTTSAVSVDALPIAKKAVAAPIKSPAATAPASAPATTATASAKKKERVSDGF